MLVGRGPPVHVLRAERDQPGLPVQVARAGARRDTRARRPVRRQRLRGGRQHPRHGLPQDAAARAGRRHEHPADLLRDQGERQPGPGGGAGGRRDHVGPAGHRVAAQRGAPADGQGHPGVAERPAAQVGPRAGAPAVLVDPVGLPRREGRLVRGHGRVAARPGAPAAAGGHAPRPVRPVQRLPRAGQPAGPDPVPDRHAVAGLPGRAGRPGRAGVLLHHRAEQRAVADHPDASSRR